MLLTDCFHVDGPLADIVIFTAVKPSRSISRATTTWAIRLMLHLIRMSTALLLQDKLKECLIDQRVSDFYLIGSTTSMIRCQNLDTTTITPRVIISRNWSSSQARLVQWSYKSQPQKSMVMHPRLHPRLQQPRRPPPERRRLPLRKLPLERKRPLPRRPQQLQSPKPTRKRLPLQYVPCASRVFQPVDCSD